MARMIPTTGPNPNDSFIAEPDIYWRLSKQLSDDFIVIHSVPWLSSAVKQINEESLVHGKAIKPTPTGEIDFLIIHATFGLLALEVKGGEIGHTRNGFVYLKTRKRLDPVTQVRKGIHGLAHWLFETTGIALRIGYTIIFHGSDFDDRALPPGVFDPNVSPRQPLLLGKSDLPFLGEKIQKLMSYWRQQPNTRSLKNWEIEKIVDAICPVVDYSQRWKTRISFDEKTWLCLTEDQTICLNKIIEYNKFVVNGWPGTGKTLLAISLARNLAERKKHTIFLTFNTLLSNFIRNELSDHKLIKVMTFHELCRNSAKILERNFSLQTEDSRELYDSILPQCLFDAYCTGLLPQYDALIIDEAQAFKSNWWEILAKWMKDKKIIAFCDETQVFDFEEGIHPRDISESLNISIPYYTLTLNLRSPKVIFNQMQKIVASQVQVYNPRPLEVDALTEIAVNNPEEYLYETLSQLLEEGIPHENIIVLYTSPPSILEEIHNELKIKTESIRKFRGMESPVVVIYAVGSPSDITLFCGYSRATSRCIAIYWAYEIVQERCGKLGQALLATEQGHLIREEVEASYTKNIIKNIGVHLEEIISGTANISWSQDWSSWVVEIKEPEIFSELWIDYLAMNSKFPIYYFTSTMRSEMRRVTPPFKINEDRTNDFMVLAQCNSCSKVIPHKYNFLTRTISCIFCFEEPQKHIGHPYTEKSNILRFENILLCPDKFEPKEKRELPLNLITIGRWKKLGSDIQDNLKKLIIGSGKIGYQSALVLTAVDIVELEIKNQIVLSEISEKYWKWSKSLPEIITLNEWKRTVGHAISVWIKRGWLKKINNGVYEKTSELPLN